MTPPVHDSSQDSLPSQRLQISGDGNDFFIMKTAWDSTQRTPYVAMDMIEAHCRGYTVRSVTTSDNISVDFLRVDGVLYEPLRIPYTKDVLMLKLIKKTGLDLERDGSLTEVLKFMEQRTRALLHEIMEQNSTNADILRTEIAENMAFIRGHPADAAKIAAPKLEELLLYPVPRYFYLRLRKKNIFRETLQMYLLCECGIYHHVDDDDVNTQGFYSCDNDSGSCPMELQSTRISDRRPSLNKDTVAKDDALMIHLSNHPGYRIVKAPEFFQKHHSYVQNVMLFLRCSVMLAGIVVPGLASIGQSAWYSTVQACMNYNNPSFSEPFLSAMEYVVKTMSVEQELKSWDHTTDLNELFLFDDSEYKQFAEFLNKLDTHKENGYLIATFCPRTGHLRWLCRDHAPLSKKGEQRVNFLEEVVRKHGKYLTYFHRATGELRIPVLPVETTSQLYKALEQAPGITKVVATLTPNTTQRDFEALIKTLEKSSTPIICLDGKLAGKKTGSWSSSVFDVMSNDRCQTLQVIGFKDFFKNISMRKRVVCPIWFKSLDLQCDLESEQQSELIKVLTHCRALLYLTIKTTYKTKLREAICETLPCLQRLTVTDLDDKNSTILRFSKNDNGITTYIIEIHARDGIPLLDSSTLLYLTRLRLDNQNELDQVFHDRLDSLIQASPKLQTIHLQLPLRQFGPLAKFLEKEFKKEINSNGVTDNVRHIHLRSLKDEHTVWMKASFQGHKIVHNDIEVEMTANCNGKDKNSHLGEFFQLYGSYVRLLILNSSMDDALLQAYITSIANDSPELSVLSVDCSGLSIDDGVEQFQRVLDCSLGLETFALSPTSFESQDKQTIVKRFIELYGTRITNLSLNGRGSSALLSEETIDRAQLMKLQHLAVDFLDETSVTSQAVDKILRLVSAPTTSDLPPLRSVSVCHCRFSPREWEQILTGLDLRRIEALSFKATNFGPAEMKALVRKIPNPTNLPLSELDIRKTPAANYERRAPLETELRLRLPKISVIVHDDSP
ncbi:hypothetical protein EMPS_03820 [Entomortierella parvispora]|uniref:Uncharacterized protein n=1 Tax=Entomortierella parvispora TaxID=205924 RepID=A0A9P3LV80_9FUNG|nr:hypothetical protein EMPS_03820 [Entomortierella parvispora]